MPRKRDAAKFAAVLAWGIALVICSWAWNQLARPFRVTRHRERCTCQGGEHQPVGVQLRANDCPMHGEFVDCGRCGALVIQCNECPECGLLDQW